MPVKRSLMVRSSSSGETKVAVSPIGESPDLRRRNPAATATSGSSSPGNSASVPEPKLRLFNQTRPSILTVGSPVRVHIDVKSNQGGKIGDFLEKCYYCEKKIEEDAEIFMLSELRAFCTAECREFQIALDKSEEVAGQLAQPMTQRQATKRMKDQFGSWNHAGP
ncbi:hypothetical protein Ancab_020044 [Ancistrocladus abbreviatus]